MRQPEEQFGLEQAINRVEAEPPKPTPWVERIRRATKLAAAGIVAAALSSCAADDTDYYDLSKDAPTESAEVQSEKMEIWMSGFDATNLKSFYFSLKNAQDKRVAFTVSRLEDPTDQFVVETDGSNPVVLSGNFGEPVEVAVVIEKAVNLENGEELTEDDIVGLGKVIELKQE